MLQRLSLPYTALERALQTLPIDVNHTRQISRTPPKMSEEAHARSLAARRTRYERRAACYPYRRPSTTVVSRRS